MKTISIFRKLLLLLILLSVTVLGAQPAGKNKKQQEPELPPLQSMQKYLSDSGFECEIKRENDEDFLGCHTESLDKPDFRLHSWSGGFRVFTYYLTKEGVTPQSEELRGLVNALNENAVITRYYIDEDADVAAEFWYPFPDFRAEVFRAMTEAFYADWNTSVEEFQDAFRRLLNTGDSENDETDT